ncbi:hypothetical protein NP493_1630g00022 [Ridgeia piscesae]|uniref:Mediator of RNA polymerase II transcription subunit 27 n=1 Tax=Ridgeia piscesae TaxID=27915 RepID=A0AAD9JX60_RIDPI|nr:hypothetical protein NP493_1630g00022 [Ridgeia piscesae]
MATEVVSQLSNAIKMVQELRLSVTRVAEQLSCGMKKPTSEEAGAQSKEKLFLFDLQKNLLAVNTYMSDLEKSTAIVLPPGVMSLGNSSLLTLDPVVDKTPLYSQLMQSYKWSNKMHEHASLAASLLTQNTLKRSHLSGSYHAKRPRKTPSSSHVVPPQIVDTLIQTFRRRFTDMPIVVARPFGSPAFLQVTLARTLKAVIVLRGLIIEWVLVKGFAEETLNEKGEPDIWSKSKYTVFQKVTDHANAAMLHYHTPHVSGQLALQSFMTWLHSYVSLFSQSCHKCGSHLLDNLPPTWRDFRTLDAYHESCRP